MHAFMLILAILGQPERAAAICDTYKACSDLGADASTRSRDRRRNQRGAHLAH